MGWDLGVIAGISPMVDRRIFANVVATARVAAWVTGARAIRTERMVACNALHKAPFRGLDNLAWCHAHVADEGASAPLLTTKARAAPSAWCATQQPDGDQDRRGCPRCATTCSQGHVRARVHGTVRYYEGEPGGASSSVSERRMAFLEDAGERDPVSLNGFGGAVLQMARWPRAGGGRAARAASGDIDIAAGGHSLAGSRRRRSIEAAGGPQRATATCAARRRAAAAASRRRRATC